MKLELCFGAFAPSIEAQLKDYNTGVDMHYFQTLADSVTHLDLANLMTEYQAKKARQKLADMIFSVVEYYKNGN